MFRVIVCSAALLLLIYATRSFLTAGFEHFGFATGAIIGSGFCLLIVILAFFYDHVERRREQRLPPAARRDRQP